MSLEQSYHQKPVVGTYDSKQTQAWEHGRNIAESESNWKAETEFAVPGLDELLSEQIEESLASGRLELAVLDIGSGNGGLMQDVVRNPKQLAKSWQLLQANPMFRIKLIGLTDAQKPEDFLAKTTLPVGPENTQVTADNYFYTLTAIQTIERFLEAVQQNQVQLVLATVSLAYMGPNTFVQVMDDSLAALGPNGKMLISEYAGKHPGFHTFSITRQLNRKGLAHSDIKWQRDLLALTKGDASADEVSLSTFLSMAEDVMGRFKHVPELAQAFELARKKMEPRMATVPKLLRNIFVGRKTKEHELFMLKEAFVSSLIRGILELGERKVKDLWREKNRLLDLFVQQHQAEIAEFKRSDFTIYLQKVGATKQADAEAA